MPTVNIASRSGCDIGTVTKSAVPAQPGGRLTGCDNGMFNSAPMGPSPACNGKWLRYWYVTEYLTGSLQLAVPSGFASDDPVGASAWRIDAKLLNVVSILASAPYFSVPAIPVENFKRLLYWVGNAHCSTIGTATKSAMPARPVDRLSGWASASSHQSSYGRPSIGSAKWWRYW